MSVWMSFGQHGTFRLLRTRHAGWHAQLPPALLGPGWAAACLPQQLAALVKASRSFAGLPSPHAGAGFVGARGHVLLVRKGSVTIAASGHSQRIDW